MRDPLEEPQDGDMATVAGLHWDYDAGKATWHCFGSGGDGKRQVLWSVVYCDDGGTSDGHWHVYGGKLQNLQVYSTVREAMESVLDVPERMPSLDDVFATLQERTIEEYEAEPTWADLARESGTMLIAVGFQGGVFAVLWSLFVVPLGVPFLSYGQGVGFAVMATLLNPMGTKQRGEKTEMVAMKHAGRSMMALVLGFLAWMLMQAGA